MNETCRLCGSKAGLLHVDTQRYFECAACGSVFVAEADLPQPNEEKERYELHDTVIDEGFRKFVSPIILHVKADFGALDKGLDFGAGRSEVVGRILRESGYDISSYDPYFHNYPELLQNRYDYITSCEVVEHFYKPYESFVQLRKMLRRGGKLYIMTELLDAQRDFASWYYKNDPTHVFFYSQKSFEWIADNIGFESFYVEKRLVVLNV